MITLNKLEEFIPSSIIDALNKDNLFGRLLNEVKRELSAMGITITSNYILPIELYRPVAYIFTYLAAIKNVELISKEMLNTFNSNYSNACSMVKSYAATNTVSITTELKISGSDFTNSEYYLR